MVARKHKSFPPSALSWGQSGTLDNTAVYQSALVELCGAVDPDSIRPNVFVTDARKKNFSLLILVGL
jgi:hypothetical protein